MSSDSEQLNNYNLFVKKHPRENSYWDKILEDYIIKLLKIMY